MILMVSLVTAMARNYYHFFDHDIWDEKKASQYFCGLSDLDRRKEYVRTVYEIVLGSDRVKEPVKILITETNGNKEQAALLYNRRHRKEEGFKKSSESSINNMVFYIGTKVADTFMIQDENYRPVMTPFDRVLMNDEISTEEWNQMDDMLERFGNTFYKSEFDKHLFLYLPLTETVSTCSDENFYDFLNLITPYFLHQRGAAEHRVKEYTEEIGYLRFLYSPYSKLTRKDKDRKAIVDRLLSKEDYIKVTKDMDARAEEIKKLREQLKEAERQLQEEKAGNPENSCRNLTNSFLIHVGSIIIGTYYQERLTGQKGLLKGRISKINQMVRELGYDHLMAEYPDVPYAEMKSK